MSSYAQGPASMTSAAIAMFKMPPTVTDYNENKIYITISTAMNEVNELMFYRIECNRHRVRKPIG